MTTKSQRSGLNRRPLSTESGGFEQKTCGDNDFASQNATLTLENQAESHPKSVPETSLVSRPCSRCKTDDEAAFSYRTKNGRRVRQALCKPCQVEYHRQWRAKPEGRAKMRAGVAASKARHPERIKAAEKVRAAIKTGRLVVGPCYNAGVDCSGKIEAHHHDYEQPLDVIWTCRAHHRALDRARRALESAA